MYEAIDTKAYSGHGPTVFARNHDPEDQYQGQSYIRTLICRGFSALEMKDGNYVRPDDVARRRYGRTHPGLVEYVKAAVAGGGTGSGEWGSELAQADSRYNGDFIELLRSRTVYDQLPLRRVPARVHIKGQDGAANGYWVGESKAIPVSKADFSDVELEPLKVAVIAVASKDLIRDSDPSAELLIRDEIVNASGQRVDQTFLSTAAASAGVSPAGMLNGLSALAPSGTDAAAVRADYQALIHPFIAAKNATGLVHVLNPLQALALSLMTTTLGINEFPDISETGGTLFKRPVFVGDNVESGHWIVLKPSDIWRIGDGGVDVSISAEAAIEMDSAPQGASDTPVASSSLVSMYQTESVAYKVVRHLNYAKRRTGAVVYLSDAEYGAVLS